MGLYEEIYNLVEDKAVIAITGGGGKTTLMENLAYFLRSLGKSILITTTTKVASPKFHDYKVDYIYSGDEIFSHYVKKGESVFYAERSYDIKKWYAPSLDNISLLKESYDYIIYEADGSRGLPLKYHTDRDPVILPETALCVGIMGLWGIGYKAYEMCFGDGSDRTIDKEYLDEYISSKEGLSKGFDRCKRGIFVFNGGEDFHNLDLLKSLSIDKRIKTFVASEQKDIVYATF